MWLFFTILFIFCQIAFLQLFKYCTRRTNDVGSLTVLVQIISAISILVLIPFYEWTWSSDWVTWLLMILAFLLYAINDRIDATTRKNLEISTDTMIQQVYRLFFFATGIIFLNRSFTVIKLVGGVIIVLANIFVLFEKGKFRFNKYVLLKFLSTIIFTAAFTLETFNSAGFNLPFFVFMTFAVPATFLIIGRQTTPKRIILEARRKEFPVILLCGVFQALTAFYILRAYQFQERFMEVAVLSSLYVILNVFFAYFFLKEKNGIVRKIIAGAVIVSAIIMIAVG